MSAESLLVMPQAFNRSDGSNPGVMQLPGEPVGFFSHSSSGGSFADASAPSTTEAGTPSRSDAAGSGSPSQFLSNPTASLSPLNASSSTLTPSPAPPTSGTRAFKPSSRAVPSQSPNDKPAATVAAGAGNLNSISPAAPMTAAAAASTVSPFHQAMHLTSPHTPQPPISFPHRPVGTAPGRLHSPLPHRAVGSPLRIHSPVPRSTGVSGTFGLAGQPPQSGATSVPNSASPSIAASQGSPRALSPAVTGASLPALPAVGGPQGQFEQGFMQQMAYTASGQQGTDTPPPIGAHNLHLLQPSSSSPQTPLVGSVVNSPSPLPMTSPPTHTSLPLPPNMIGQQSAPLAQATQAPQHAPSLVLPLPMMSIPQTQQQQPQGVNSPREATWPQSRGMMTQMPSQQQQQYDSNAYSMYYSLQQQQQNGTNSPQLLSGGSGAQLPPYPSSASAAAMHLASLPGGGFNPSAAGAGGVGKPNTTAAGQSMMGQQQPGTMSYQHLISQGGYQQQPPAPAGYGGYGNHSPVRVLSPMPMHFPNGQPMPQQPPYGQTAYHPYSNGTVPQLQHLLQQPNGSVSHSLPPLQVNYPDGLGGMSLDRRYSTAPSSLPAYSGGGASALAAYSTGAPPGGANSLSGYSNAGGRLGPQQGDSGSHTPPHQAMAVMQQQQQALQAQHNFRSQALQQQQAQVQQQIQQLQQQQAQLYALERGNLSFSSVPPIPPMPLSAMLSQQQPQQQQSSLVGLLPSSVPPQAALPLIRPPLAHPLHPSSGGPDGLQNGHLHHVSLAPHHSAPVHPLPHMEVGSGRGAGGNVFAPQDSTALNSKKNKDFVCNVCQEVLHSRFSLKRHLKKHTGDKPYQCTFDRCKKSFFEASTLKRHIRIHTGDKPFRCRFAHCSKAFADATNVKRHEMTHTGAKPFVCSTDGCSRAFSRSSSLKQHMSSLHKIDINTISPAMISPQGVDPHGNPKPVKHSSAPRASPSATLLSMPGSRARAPSSSRKRRGKANLSEEESESAESEDEEYEAEDAHSGESEESESELDDAFSDTDLALATKASIAAALAQANRQQQLQQQQNGIDGPKRSLQDLDADAPPAKKPKVELNGNGTNTSTPA